MLASRLVVLWTSLWPFASAVACGPNKPAEPSGRPEPPAPSAVLSASAPSPPTVRASASASTAPRPVTATAASAVVAAAPPPDGPFASLLTKDKKIVYMLNEEVDTHDAQPGQGVAQRTGRASFTVTTVEREGETWVGEGTWASVGAEDDLLAGGAPPTGWRLRGTSIEIADDPDHTSLATAAKIASAPANTVCHHAYGKAMYGRSHREICFDRLGLVRYIEENLHGPRKLRLVRTK